MKGAQDNPLVIIIIIIIIIIFIIIIIIIVIISSSAYDVSLFLGRTDRRERESRGNEWDRDAKEQARVTSGLSPDRSIYFIYPSRYGHIARSECLGVGYKENHGRYRFTKKPAWA